MRFEVRFNNDVFHVFDTVRYTAVEAYNNNESKRAHDRVKQLNSTPRGPRRGNEAK